MDSIIIAVYAVFLYMGAFFGWKAGSKVSLIMGLSFGTLTLAALFAVKTDPKPGYGFLLILSLLLFGAFVSRFLKTRKMMPAGMLLSVTVLFLLFCAVRYINL